MLSSLFPLYPIGFRIVSLSLALPVFRQHVHLSTTTCLRGYLGVRTYIHDRDPAVVRDIPKGSLVSPSTRWGRNLVARRRSPVRGNATEYTHLYSRLMLLRGCKRERVSPDRQAQVIDKPTVRRTLGEQLQTRHRFPGSARDRRGS